MNKLSSVWIDEPKFSFENYPFKHDLILLLIRIMCLCKDMQIFFKDTQFLVNNIHSPYYRVLAQKNSRKTKHVSKRLSKPEDKFQRNKGKTVIYRSSWISNITLKTLSTTLFAAIKNLTRNKNNKQKEHVTKHT